MTKEKAIEIIERYKISDPASLYELDTNLACNMAIRAMEEIERLKAEQPKWIPVEERLPEKCDFYLVRDFGEIKMNGKKIGLTKVMMFYPEEKQWEKHNEDVTHWMPLPKPPKEDEKNGRTKGR